MALLPRTLLPLFPSMLKCLLDSSVSSIHFISAKNLRPREEHKTLSQLYAACDANQCVHVHQEMKGSRYALQSWLLVSQLVSGGVSLACTFVSQHKSKTTRERK